MYIDTIPTRAQVSLERTSCHVRKYYNSCCKEDTYPKKQVLNMVDQITPVDYTSCNCFKFLFLFPIL